MTSIARSAGPDALGWGGELHYVIVVHQALEASNILPLSSFLPSNTLLLIPNSQHPYNHVVVVVVNTADREHTAHQR